MGNRNTARADGPADRKSRFLAGVKNFSLLIAVMFACTGVSLLLRQLGTHETNFIMIYLLGTLLLSYYGGSYLFSLFSSLFGVLFYNFFFTEPYYTFRAYSPDYPLTFLIMFFVGAFTSMMTSRIRHESVLAEEREERIRALYQTGRRLLGVRSAADLAEVSAQELAAQLDASVLAVFYRADGEVQNRFVQGEDVFSSDRERVVCRETYRSCNACGRGTRLYAGANAYYSPVVTQNGVSGVVGVAPLDGRPLTENQTEFLNTVLTQLAVVLERETLYRRQEETQTQIASERLRSDMLRAISHDLRTPLTGIMGSASTMLDNYGQLDDNVKKDFLKNIYDDAGWLSDLVENILDMTRLDEGRLHLHLEEEAAEEIVAGAIAHVKGHAAGHSLSAKIPDELLLLRADGVLLTQVLVNLLDNAIYYTPEGSSVTVLLSRSDQDVLFEVRDDGPGIAEEDMEHLFERFYSRGTRPGTARHGFGLGLALCKAIVEAHGGHIFVHNVEPHGTSVLFNIPAKEEDNSCSR